MREFAPGDTEGARAFMRELEREYDRVSVDEKAGPLWRFIFSDEIRYARENLGRVTDGQEFRIRAMPRIGRRPGREE